MYNYALLCITGRFLKPGKNFPGFYFRRSERKNLNTLPLYNYPSTSQNPLKSSVFSLAEPCVSSRPVPRGGRQYQDALIYTLYILPCFTTPCDLTLSVSNTCLYLKQLSWWCKQTVSKIVQAMPKQTLQKIGNCLGDVLSRGMRSVWCDQVPLALCKKRCSPCKYSISAVLNLFPKIEFWEMLPLSGFFYTCLCAALHTYTSRKQGTKKASEWSALPVWDRALVLLWFCFGGLSTRAWEKGAAARSRWRGA